MKKKKYTFIDLFAGLGGFHQALTGLGCQCVFASELREDLRELYVQNFPGSNICGDITKIKPEEIPPHDILCGGFPCQPFSQAGKRQGFDDEKDRGNLFNYICDILAYHRPRYVFLENVSNLKGHDNGNTWDVIFHKLSDTVEEGGLNYEVKEAILSPHQYGYPQHRRRIYIVCENRDYGSLNGFEFPVPTNEVCDINQIINKKDTHVQPLSLKTHHQLKVWEEFIKQLSNRNEEIPTFPIWAMEFGANYPYTEDAPAFLSADKLRGCLGKLGTRVTGNTPDSCLKQLPVYAQTTRSKQFPNWKQRYIQQNRIFYDSQKSWIDIWLRLIESWDNSHQKLEWNCGKDCKKTLKDKIIQFRASGIRVKLPTYSPALNLVGTQVPILPWIKLPKKCIPNYTEEQLKEYNLTMEDVSYGRYMSIKEAAALQGMEQLNFGKLSTTRCYEALGNAVNVNVVKQIANRLINTL